MRRRVTIEEIKKVRDVVTLKEEIEALKQLLYRKWQQNAESHLPDNEGIIEISKQLDVKIVEYIHITRNY